LSPEEDTFAMAALPVQTRDVNAARLQPASPRDTVPLDARLSLVYEYAGSVPVTVTVTPRKDDDNARSFRIEGGYVTAPQRQSFGLWNQLTDLGGPAIAKVTYTPERGEVDGLSVGVVCRPH
jgi:hypothetical protein